MVVADTYQPLAPLVPPTVIEVFGARGVTVNVPETDDVPEVPVIVAVVVVGTPKALAVNVADVFPAAIVIDAGTVTAGVFDDKLTFTPPFGAAANKVTVPVEFETAGTDDGEKVRLAKMDVEIVNELVCVDSMLPALSTEW
jgi:hypothetical protein